MSNRRQSFWIRWFLFPVSLLVVTVTLAFTAVGPANSQPSDLNVTSDANADTTPRPETTNDQARTQLPPMSFEDPFSKPGDKPEVKLSDPFEPVNRAFFWFNNKAYFYGMEPVASGWYVIMPYQVRGKIENFFENLDSPITLVNSLLQGDPAKAGITTSRFLINSTVGIGGFFDPASYWFTIHEEDFDDTFRTWGIAPGPYVMLPLMGPSTARGSVALVLDNLLYPPNYLSGEDANKVIFGMTGVRNVNAFSFSLGQYETLQQGAIDEYAALKDVYEQRMQQGKDLLE